MIKAAVFDLDHTLFDRYKTLEIVSKKLRYAFKVNPKYSDDEIFKIMEYADRFYVHKGWDALQEYIGSTDLFLEKLEYDQYRKFVMGEFMKVAVPYPFSNSVLVQLKKEKYKLALITNGNPILQRSKIKMLQLEEYFDEIYTGCLIISDRIILSHEPIENCPPFLFNISKHFIATEAFSICFFPFKLTAMVLSPNSV